jgi:hypothetical protein
MRYPSVRGSSDAFIHQTSFNHAADAWLPEIRTILAIKTAFTPSQQDIFHTLRI